MNRRTFLAASTAMGMACGRKERPGFAGFAFVANEEGSAVAAVDLTAFAVVRHIALDGAPTQLISLDSRKAIYALTPGNGTVHEISAARLVRERKVQLGGKALQMRIAPKRNALYVLMEEPRQLVEVMLGDLRVSRRIGLPFPPVDVDLHRELPQALVSFQREAEVGIVDIEAGKVSRLDTGNAVRLVRFLRQDSRYWMSGHEDAKLLSIYDTATSKIVARLPLAVKPRNLCFKADQGQMFVTGEGLDAVAVVYPYWTEVAETVLAGNGPAAMATSHMIKGTPEFLFVTNPLVSQVTILNINESYKPVSRPVQVGSEPCFVTLTPDNQCVLVLNRGSGDMAVLMVSNSKRAKQVPTLFTMIPVGSKPVSAVVQAV